MFITYVYGTLKSFPLDSSLKAISPVVVKIKELGYHKEKNYKTEIIFTTLRLLAYYSWLLGNSQFQNMWCLNCTLGNCWMDFCAY